MAERLTEKSKRGFYLKDDFGGRIYCDDDKETINAYYGQLLIVKLGRLEDLLEKYSVDIQKLDYILNDYSKNQGRVFAICEERDDLKKDRDTWKRACELACDVLRDINYKIYNEDRIDFENIFYQEAKNKDLEEC